jgi:hypothetical protein
MDAPNTIHATDHGVLPGGAADSGAPLRSLLTRCQGRGPTRVVLAPGRYDFHVAGCQQITYPLSNTQILDARNCAIVLRDLEDLFLDLRGVELRFHGRLMPIAIEHCRRVVVEGGDLDWDFPLTAQAAVLAVTAESLELRIDRQRHPFTIVDGGLVFAAEGWSAPLSGIMEFDPVSGHIPPGSGDRSPGQWQPCRAEDLGGGRVRLHGNFAHPPRVGNVLVLRHGPRDHAGIFILDSQNIAVRSLALRHTSGLGILCQHSADLEFTGVDAVPSPGRVFAGHDDGIHVSNCRGHVAITGCRFAGLMDDPINVHGTSVRIIGILTADRLRCQFMHPESVGMSFARDGDSISFLDRRSLVSRSTAVVRQVETRDPTIFDIAFDRPLPDGLIVDDALENLSWAPDLTVRDCWFGCSRARGLLVSTPGRVRIEGNRFESSGSAILIAGDANYWFESGAVRDVLIRGNHFADICNSSDYQFTEGVISILPEIPRPDLERPFHHNIRIEDNIFELCDISALYALSVRGLRFTGNRLMRSRRYPPRLDHQHMLMHEHDFGDGCQHLITLDHCREVVIEGNSSEGELLDRRVTLLSTAERELVLDAGDGFTVLAIDGR